MFHWWQAVAIGAYIKRYGLSNVRTIGIRISGPVNDIQDGDAIIPLLQGLAAVTDRSLHFVINLECQVQQVIIIPAVSKVLPEFKEIESITILSNWPGIDQIEQLFNSLLRTNVKSITLAHGLFPTEGVTRTGLPKAENIPDEETIVARNQYVQLVLKLIAKPSLLRLEWLNSHLMRDFGQEEDDVTFWITYDHTQIISQAVTKSSLRSITLPGSLHLWTILHDDMYQNNVDRILIENKTLFVMNFAVS